MKVQQSRKDVEVQTDLSINAYCGCLSVHTNTIDTAAIKSLGSPIMLFLNTYIQKHPDKDTKSWEDVYKDSERILQSKNFPSTESAESETTSLYSIHDACLHIFFGKTGEAPPSIASNLFAYLNVFYLQLGVDNFTERKPDSLCGIYGKTAWIEQESEAQCGRTGHFREKTK